MRKKRPLDTHRIGRNVNTLLLAISDQVQTLENWVGLNLIDRWNDTGFLGDGIELFVQTRSDESNLIPGCFLFFGFESRGKKK